MTDQGTFRTPQEAFWAGEFGNAYTARNAPRTGDDVSNQALFMKVFQRTGPLRSVLEFGANVGANLTAIHHLLPRVDEISAVEINPKAVEALRQLPYVTVHAQSILDFKPDHPRELVFTKGVLIHINPAELSRVYEAMYQSASRYILVAEYYNPTPAEVTYRGHEGFLFKRDFAGELLDRYSDLRLVDYGFVYRRDPLYPQDDLTWFLLHKEQ